ncbi:MAG: hypothetical protein J6Z13_05705 [Clostridia bacterium]|nr:hypothetical protein [Clostridia bacterium]
MKKLTITLALVLCLVLCVFAFASCSKSNKGGGDATAASTTAASTTAASTTAGETEHVHTPAAEYTVDREPTCSNAGSKSYHCTVCREIIPETVVLIDPLPHTPEPEITIIQKPTCAAKGIKAYICEECGEVIESTIEEIDIDSTAHDVAEWSVEPTLLNPTVEATGECTICHQNVPKTLTYEPPITTFTSSGTKFKPVTVTLGDVRGEKHFYPTDADPDGNDLYVEFNILWDETVANFDASYIIGQMDGQPFYFLSPNATAKYADAKRAGAFEWMGHFEIPISDSEVTTPETMCGKSPNYSDYPNIMGTDEANPEYGWHRMGVRIHMELLDGHTGEALSDYLQVSTIFVDGVALCKLATTADGLKTEGTKLFSAAPDEGGVVVFSDVDTNEVRPLEIPTAKSLIDTNVYFAVDEISVTCGKGFVMPVEKVTNPTEATYTVAEGVEVTSTVWFKLAES